MSWASRGIGIGCWGIVSGLTSQQTCEDGQKQRAGMTIHGSSKTLCFDLDELILVHATWHARMTLLHKQLLGMRNETAGYTTRFLTQSSMSNATCFEE